MVLNIAMAKSYIVIDEEDYLVNSYRTINIQI
jgi:hypothetical protein